jgi:DNA-binding response OmpR family regulator
MIKLSGSQAHRYASLLIVEDDRELASMWQQFLQDQQHSVDVCSSVEDAEVLVHSNHYDLAIVDIFLREGNRVLSEGGVTLINRLRLKEATSHSGHRIKLIAITGAPERAFGQFNALDSVTDLSDCVLHKPIPLETLGKEVARLFMANT